MHRVLVYTREIHQLDTIMSTEDMIKVIAHSKRERDVEEEIANLEGKPALTDDGIHYVQ